MHGHNTKQKVTAALRMMAYGVPAYLIDDNFGNRRKHFNLLCESIGEGDSTQKCLVENILEHPMLKTLRGYWR